MYAFSDSLAVEFTLASLMISSLQMNQLLLCVPLPFFTA